jgi:magnesium-transporting ATPase (P-type)
VILDDRFASILKAVKWGKHTFNIIKKFLSLQLTINLVAAIMALLGAIFLGESPLHPMQMLWINIIIDIFGSISLILEKPLEMEINRTPYRRRDKILTTDMIKLIVVQAFVQVVILSGILFAGPALLGIVSSVSVEEWNIETGKHESVFFNTFIMLQIFNEYNLRVLTFDKINVFEGLLQNPLFLCFSVTSFIL